MKHKSLYKDINSPQIQVCKRCIYDDRVPSITFDEKGICNYCGQIEELKKAYGTGKPRGEEEFKRIVEEIKANGKNKRYDCIIGVSGGTDSSYLVYLAKQNGLRPLAVHYDNTWNSAVATTNIEKVLRKLEIDLETHVVSNKEADDIFKSFFKAGVPEIEASTDLGYAYTLRKAAAKFSVKYILEGHSFVEEGITPLGHNYFDGRYIREIHKQYGEIKIQTYPLMTLTKFIKSCIWDNLNFIRPLWYIKYSKKEARKLLEEKFQWKYYGGHHLENRMTAFYHTIYLPNKFNSDMRNNTLSADARNGYKTREEAWRLYTSPPVQDEELVRYFRKRLKLSEQEYKKIMSEEPKNWKEFPTYKKHFEILRPLFFILAKGNKVPMSFYLKYCRPN